MTQSRQSQLNENMSEIIAERRLLWAPKGESNRSEFVIRIGTPVVVEPETVDFPVRDGTGACSRHFHGFPVKIDDTIYGADTIQALQMAADVDSILRRFSDRYDFFFPTGEPYFENDST